MDFKSILTKFSAIETPPKSVEAPKAANPIRLDEGTELRVLAGVTALTESVIAEKAVSKSQQQAAGAALAAKRGDASKSGLKSASKEMMKMSTKELEKIAGTKHKGLPKKKTEESVKEDMKVGDTKKSATGGTITKTSTGVKHTAKAWDGEDHTEPAQSKASKKGMTGAERRDQKAKDKEQEKASKDYEKKYPGSVKRHKMEDIEEAAKPDFLDMDKDGNKKEPMKKAAKEAGKGEKKDGKKGMSAKQEKYFGKKKTNESLSFRQAIKIVKESKGDFQIDPVDRELWSWAERVGKNKFTESIQAQAFAAATYERMGGEWNLHKRLNESKQLNESYLSEGVIDKIKMLIPKVMKVMGDKLSAQIAEKVKAITGGDLSANPENAEKVARAFGFDKIVKDKAMSKEDIMGEGLAGNWQGKLVQFLYLAGLGGSAAGAASMWGTVGGSFMAIIGTLLIMFAATFFDDDRGMVGAMGKHGNKGFDTSRGPRSGVDLSRGDAGPLD